MKKKIQALPGIVGYVVKPGDTLWKIAKISILLWTALKLLMN